MKQLTAKPSAEQQLAIQGKEKHKTIIAGPGTGKTTLLCHDIRYLINKGHGADSILLLTFSKSAAKNMAIRLEEKFGINSVKCSTLHAFGLKILMSYWQKLGFTEKPVVRTRLIRQTQDQIIKRAIKGLSNKADKKIVKRTVRQTLKNPTQIHKAHENVGIENRINQAIKTCTRVLLNRKKQNWVTYNDMIDLPLQLFQDHPEILRQGSWDISHLLVDEAQDISMNEARLIYLLAKNTQSSMIVGDAKQSIYGFRGADPECMAMLMIKLKAEAYYLTESFRLPKQSLALTNSVANDINNDPTLTSSQSGYKPRFVQVENFDQQADVVSSKIRTLLDQGVAPHEIAILARRWRSLILLNNTPQFADLPIDQTFKSSGDKPDLALLALIRITQWWANKPRRGDHPFTLKKSLLRLLRFYGISKKLRQLAITRVREQGWEKFSIPQKIAKSKYRWLLNLRKAVITAATLSPESGIQLLIDAFKPILKHKFKRDKLRILTEWRTIKIQLRDHHTWSSIKPSKLIFPQYHEDGIEMLSVHKSKGREWSYVFLIDVVESEFPLYFHQSQLDIDQERRVFYVAISRVSKRLTIIQAPVFRNNFKKGEIKNTKIPRLINDCSCFTNDYYSTMKRVVV